SIKFGANSGSYGQFFSWGTGSSTDHRDFYFYANDLYFRTATSDEGGSSATRMTLKHTTGYVGINANPDARFEVSTGSAEGRQAITIDQNDADKAFIDFQGTSAASAANNISTWTNATLNGFVRMEINGANKWIAYYNAPTS
ncbi:hypothetical protein LCGC14_2035500, partial [marine sediment metagenome]